MSFEAYVCDDPSAQVLADQCKVVFPDDALFDDMTVYCGFCGRPLRGMAPAFQSQGLLPERGRLGDPRRQGLRYRLYRGRPGAAPGGQYFSCSVASRKAGLIFNNKGLNYSYRLDLGEDPRRCRGPRNLRSRRTSG